MNIPVLLTTKYSCFENYATRPIPRLDLWLFMAKLRARLSLPVCSAGIPPVFPGRVRLMRLLFLQCGRTGYLRYAAHPKHRDHRAR